MKYIQKRAYYNRNLYDSLNIQLRNSKTPAKLENPKKGPKKPLQNSISNKEAN